MDAYATYTINQQQRDFSLNNDETIRLKGVVISHTAEDLKSFHSHNLEEATGQMKLTKVLVGTAITTVLVGGGIGTAFASGVDPFDPATYETNFGPGEPYYQQNVAIRNAWATASTEEKLGAVFHPTDPHPYDPFGLDTSPKVKLAISYGNLKSGGHIPNPGYLTPKGYPDVLDAAPFKAHYKPTVKADK